MLKNILLTILNKLGEVEAHNDKIMKECIDKKLERSLSNYESHLEETCKFILDRNPITVIKLMAEDPKPKSKEDEYYGI